MSFEKGLPELSNPINLPPLWHLGLQWVGTSKQVWEVSTGRRISRELKQQVKDPRRKSKDDIPASTTHMGKWCDKNVAIYLACCEWKWKVSSSYSVCHLPPSQAHLRFTQIPLFFSPSLPTSPAPGISWFSHCDDLSSYLFICYGWTLMLTDTPFSVPLTVSFFLSTFT